MKTAVLVDGAFFLKCFRSSFPDRDHRDASIVADTLFAVAVEHVRRVRRPKEALYRIFFYDCPPFDKKMHLPLSGRAVDFKRSKLAFKRLVDQVILIAGDSDFVPAAKLARREGIDFILNAMGQPISPHLFEHIDGLHQIQLKPLVARLQSASAHHTDDAPPLEAHD